MKKIDSLIDDLSVSYANVKIDDIPQEVYKRVIDLIDELN